MKDPAQAIRDHLVSAGLGAFGVLTGWSINIGRWPDAPDTAILVQTTGGRNPFPHLLYNEPTVQVLVRGTKSGYQAARTKAEAVQARLTGMSSVNLLGDIYRSSNQMGDIMYLGQDENTRPMFSMNFWFVVLPAAESGESRLPIT